MDLRWSWSRCIGDTGVRENDKSMGERSRADAEVRVKRLPVVVCGGISQLPIQ